MSTTADRMRSLEHAQRLDDTWQPGQYLVVRCDGRSFTSYTRNLDKPFDDQFSRDMDGAAAALTSDVAAPVLTYIQSDEISTIMSRPNENAQWWFGGNLTKIGSVAAACVTATFNQRRPGTPAMFDARCITLDSVDDVAEYLIWRQRDAYRNAVGMLARHQFSHRALHGRNTSERLEMLAAIGVHIDEIDARHTLGRIRHSRVETGPVTYTDRRTGLECTTETVTRRVWETTVAPRFDLGNVAELLGVTPTEIRSAA